MPSYGCLQILFVRVDILGTILFTGHCSSLLQFERLGVETLVTAEVNHCGTAATSIDLDLFQTNSIQNDPNSSSAVS